MRLISVNVNKARGVSMTDNEYVQRVREMENRLYRIAQAMLWRHADCVDAVQETVFRGWMKKRSIRERSYFETWIIRILINVCKDMLRRRRHEGVELPEDLHSQEQLCENLHLRLTLRQMPEKYRMLLLLHYMEGYSHAEISRILKIPLTMVNSRMHQARRMLRTKLEGGDAK